MVIDIEQLNNTKKYSEFKSQELENLLKEKTCKLCNRPAIAIYSQEGKEFEFYCKKHIEIPINFANTALNYLTPFLLYVKYKGGGKWIKKIKPRKKQKKT